MTPEDKKWIISMITAIARQDVDITAQMQVLKEAVAELVAKNSGGEYAAVLAEIDAKIQSRQEKYLFSLEDKLPWMAALMDEGRGPQAPEA